MLTILTKQPITASLHSWGEFSDRSHPALPKNRRFIHEIGVSDCTESSAFLRCCTQSLSELRWRGHQALPIGAVRTWVVRRFGRTDYLSRASLKRMLD